MMKLNFWMVNIYNNNICIYIYIYLELDELDDEIVNERLDEGTGVPAYMPQKGQEVPANKEEDDLAMMMN